LHRAAEVSSNLAVRSSIGFSCIYLIINSFYGYAFFFGGMLRWSPDENLINDYTGKKYTGGEVIGILFCVLFGMF